VQTKATEKKAGSADPLVQLGRSVIQIESAAVAALEERIDQEFAKACQMLLNCTGRIVITGIGKSGHVGSKMAATFASTGSPAFFVHAAEASHGDLGMFKSDDVVIAISYSGNSNELLTLTPGIKRLGIPLIGLCGEPDSALAKASDVVLSTRVEREACPLGLAPTTSTTVTLVLGDALAVALLGVKGFTEEDFARSHPGGRLGRRLLINIQDVLISGNDAPVCSEKATLTEALVEISSKGLGMVAVVDANQALVGIFTDGDLRRTFASGNDIREMSIASVMTEDPTTISKDALAVTAVAKMQELKITSLPVVENNILIGVVTMHGLLAAGVV